MDGCERLGNVEQTHPQPPDPQSETGALAMHSGKRKETDGHTLAAWRLETQSYLGVLVFTKLWRQRLLFDVLKIVVDVFPWCSGAKIARWDVSMTVTNVCRNRYGETYTRVHCIFRCAHDIYTIIHTHTHTRKHSGLNVFKHIANSRLQLCSRQEALSARLHIKLQADPL